MRALVLMVVVLAGCAQDDGEWFRTAEFQRITVTVRQVERGEVGRYCGPAAVACYDPAADIITVPVITSDADHEGHRLLGHELWHRLGGHHH